MLDFSFGETLMRQRVEEEQRRAELGRLAREARMARPGWASRQKCRLGRLMMGLGSRLVDACPMQAPPAEQHALPG